MTFTNIVEYKQFLISPLKNSLKKVSFSKERDGQEWNNILTWAAAAAALFRLVGWSFTFSWECNLHSPGCPFIFCLEKGSCSMSAFMFHHFHSVKDVAFPFCHKCSIFCHRPTVRQTNNKTKTLRCDWNDFLQLFLFSTPPFITDCLSAAFSAFHLHAKKVFWWSESMTSIRAVQKKAGTCVLLSQKKCAKRSRCTSLDRVMFHVCAWPKSCWTVCSVVMPDGCLLGDDSRFLSLTFALIHYICKQSINRQYKSCGTEDSVPSTCSLTNVMKAVCVLLI